VPLPAQLAAHGHESLASARARAHRALFVAGARIDARRIASSVERE
jgi:hypothetical protein